MTPRTLASRPISFVIRSKPSLPRNRFAPIQARFVSDKDVPNPPAEPGSKGPNMEQLPHVTEEQAALDKSMGQTPPDISQGTPVQEMLERDKDAQKNAPQVIKEEMKNGGPGSGQKRSYSTSARRLQEGMLDTHQQPQNTVFIEGMIQGMIYPGAGPGHKFPLPDPSKITRLDHLKQRYDPVVDQFTKAIMRSGKLSQAQKNMTHILDSLRTSPPPQPSAALPGRTLLLTDTANSRSKSGTSITLPRSTLPLHPVEYLTTVVDSVSPLIKIRQQRGVAGGGASLPIPIPLGIRQRRRQAIKWILAAADGRKDVNLADRVAKEIVSVAEGKSGVWERRAMAHRLGMSARSNVKPGAMRMRKSF